MDKLIFELAIPTGIAILSFLGLFIYDKGMDAFEIVANSLKNFLFCLKFEEREKLIISKYLESRYRNLRNDLRYLARDLIDNQKGKKCLDKISEKIKKVISNNKNLEIFLSGKKKVFILGETGVGKSTLINCIEGNDKLAPEAKVGAPTTMEFKEYISEKHKNYIFCDTRGIETKNISEIEKLNIKNILEHSKGLNSYLFWYLKGASSNFQDSDAEYIKSIEKSLNGKMPLFFVITKSIDEEEEKKRLEIAVKEHFPYNKTIKIFPVLARGNKRTQAFGLDELMKGTEMFFKDILLKEVFKYIYKDDKKYNELYLSYLKKSYIEDLFYLILNYIRLDKYDNSLDSEEKKTIENFISINYKHFIFSNIDEIAQLCCLIKAKHEIIDINNTEQTTKRLTFINNSSEDIDNLHPKNEILKGISEKEMKIVELKAKKYYYKENIKSEVKLLLDGYVATLFNIELNNQIKENLLNNSKWIN